MTTVIKRLVVYMRFLSQFQTFYYFFFYDKISQALESTKKHNQYIGFSQDKSLSTLNNLFFFQDKILNQMSP